MEPFLDRDLFATPRRRSRLLRHRTLAVLTALILVPTAAAGIAGAGTMPGPHDARTFVAAAAAQGVPLAAAIDTVASSLYRTVCPYLYLCPSDARVTVSAAENDRTRQPETAPPLPPAETTAVAPAVAIAATSSPAALSPTAGEPLRSATIINQPVIERVVETQRVITESGISETTLADRLNGLENKLRSLIFSQGSQQTAQTSAVYNAVAQSQRIDNLANTTITNPTITGGSISASSISGTISNAIDAAAAAVVSLTGTELTYTRATFENATTTNATSTTLAVFTAPVAPSYTATSTTATSTFAGGLSVSGNSALATTTITGALTVNGNTNITEGGQLTVGDKIIAPGEIGLGTTTPAAKLAIQNTEPTQTALLIYATTSQSAPLLDIFSNTNSNLMRLSAAGLLSVSGTASTSNLVASNSFTLGTLTGILKATAGAVATALVNLASDVTGTLPVANGGTGWAAIQSGAIPYGNGTSAVATSSGLSFDGAKLTATYASSTALSVSGTIYSGAASTTNLTVSSAPSALLVTNSSGVASAYSGTTCTNQFVRSLNGAGVATCASVSLTADMTGTLPVANGGTNATSLGSHMLLAFDGTGIVASSTPTAANYRATSTTATSTFSGGATFATGGGNVGIGTANPSASLEVKGQKNGTLLNIQSDLAAVSDYFDLRFDAGTGGLTDNTIRLVADNPPKYRDFAFRLNGNEILRMQGDGNVGIGLTSPAFPLSVASSTDGLNYGLQIMNNANDNANTATGILFTSGTGSTRGKGALVYSQNGSGWNRGDFLFLQEASANANYPTLSNAALAINNNGNIGIGTASPGNRLSVNTPTTAADASVLITQSGSGATQGLVVQQTSGFTVVPVFSIQNSSGNNVFSVSGDGTFTGSNGVSSGIFTIGQGGGGPYLKLNFNGGTAVRVGYDNGQYYIYDETSALRRFVISSTGNVGVGTTTPWRKFSVTGTVGFDGLGSIGGTQTLCLTDSKEVVTNNGACTSSSLELKHDISMLAVSGGDMLASFRPVAFTYNNGTRETWGFVAENLAVIDPHFIDYFDQNGNPRTINTTSILAVVVKAAQELAHKLDELAATVANFADTFTTRELTFVRAHGDEIDVQKLCIGQTCVTETQLQALLASAGLAGVASEASQETVAVSTSTPPVIAIAGENPAHIHVGDTYQDLGASAKDSAGHELSLTYFLNGALMSDIVIDTTAAATDTIDYVATDGDGNTATSTRTIIIEAQEQAAQVGDTVVEFAMPEAVPDSATSTPQ